MPHATNLTCEEWNFGSPISTDSAAVEPFRHCVATAADTSFSIMHGRGRYVIWIGRSWRPSGGQTQAYEQLVAELTSRHGPAHLCPQSDEVSVWQDRKWQVPGYSISVARVDEDHVAHSFHLGSIECHVV
jgi:hypothetical protein